MRVRVMSARIVLAGLLVAGVAGSAAAQIGRVNGVVKDEAGQPLKGATITADNHDTGQTFTATTDDKGRFAMIGLRGGEWRFVAQALGFTPNGGQMPVRMGTPNPPIVFTLKKSTFIAYGPLGSISGKDLQSDLGAADALFAQSRWDASIGAYKALLEKAPTLTVLKLQIAAAYRNKQDYAEAASTYDALLKVDPDNEKAAVGLATLSLERGDAGAAADVLMRAAQSEGAGREVFFTLAEMRLAKGDVADAARWYQKASAADPYWGKPLYKMGLCAIQGGDARGAAGLMAQVIAVDPASPEASLAKAALETLPK